MRDAFRELAARDRRRPHAEEVADGFIRIAVENMANAIKKISVRARLRRDRVRAQLLRLGRRPARLPDRRHARHGDGAHPSAVGPAVGLRHGARPDPRQPRAIGRGAARRPSHARDRARCATRLGSATTRGGCWTRASTHGDIALTAWPHLRYDGTDTALPVPLAEPRSMRRDFEALHRQRFGFVSPEKRVFVAALEVEAAGGEVPDLAEVGPRQSGARPLASTRRVDTDRERACALLLTAAPGMTRPSIVREALEPGHRLAGPALVIEPHQTVVVEPGWSLEVTARDDLVLAPHRAAPARGAGQDRRPRAARGVQQPLHVDRRADGRSAAQHGAVGQHQGAARFLLRRVRRHRASSSPTRRTCRCTWAAWTARSRP